MVSINLGWMLALGLVGLGDHDHRAVRHGNPEGRSFESGPVRRQIQILRSSRKKDDREDAAEELRKLDWRTHPEAVLALADALILDPSDDVREEAAESLRKMGACVPQAHEALIRAASFDPDNGVRKEARKALGSIGRRCVADCGTCGSVPTGSVIPPDWVPILAPEPVTTPEPILEPLPSALPDDPPPPPTPADSAARSRSTSRVR